MQQNNEVGMHPQLRPFVQIVDGLAAILGEDCEILLHDTSRLEHSIVACANGHITGRPLGSPMTGYGLKLLNSDVFSHNNNIHTYMARANNGALIKCGVISLRDDEGRVIGLLCIHMDTAKAQVARELLDSFFGVRKDEPREEPINEYFGLEIEDVFKSTMQEVHVAGDRPLYSLSKQEKLEIVKSLSERGFFMMKGAVDYVAGEMGNSKFTIYSYMRELEKNGKDAID